MSYIPNVIERTPNSEHMYDLLSKLLKERIVLLYGEIDDAMSATVCAQILYLASLNDEPIQIYINSPGGSVYAGLAIYDTMQFVKCPIQTLCLGIAASMAAIILCGGTAGQRSALPNSEIMIHQPLGGVKGQASDMEIAARHIIKTKEKLIDILHQHTNQPIEKLQIDCDRDYYMDPKEAQEYGLIDLIY